MEILFETIHLKRDKDVHIHVSAFRYTVFILQFYKVRGCRREVVKVYENLKFEQLAKYHWLFRRKAALLQLENPQNVYCFQINKEATKEELYDFKVKHLKNKIRSAKGKLTEKNRKLKKAKSEWNSLFPIEEDETYIKVIEYLRKKEVSLNLMQKELKNLL